MNNLIILLLMGFTLLSHTVISQEFIGESKPIHSLNSRYAEEFVVLHPSGSQLAFSRANHPYNQGGNSDLGDIWLSRYDSVWHAASNWHSVNTDHFSSPIGWTADGETFLYNVVKTAGGSLKTEIWLSHKGRSQPLDVAYFKNKSAHQSGCLSADNRYLIVSMESGSTQGVEDLYLLERNGQSWKAPKNLGPAINTKYQEVTPFLSPDGMRLYFATNGREGFGSFDIYVSDRLDDTWRNWSEPRNLGPMVNSSGRETSFVYAPGSAFAYFSSTRNSDGYGDIRRVEFRTDSTDVISEVDTTTFLVGTEVELFGIQLINAKSGQAIAGDVAIRTTNGGQMFTPNADGIITLDNQTTGTIDAEGYLAKDFDYVPETLLTLWLEPLEVGRTIRLENVLFRRGTASMLESSYPELDRLAEMMKSNADVRILLKGHTDGNGDPAQNLALSQERALAARKYLISKGIKKKRIKSQGFGGEEPIASNETEETRQLNRRVEIEIIE